MTAPQQPVPADMADEPGRAPEDDAWDWLNGDYLEPADYAFGADDMVDAFIAGRASRTPPPEANAAQEGDGSEVRAALSALVEQMRVPEAVWTDGSVDFRIAMPTVEAARAALAATPPPSAPVDAGPVVTAAMVQEALACCQPFSAGLDVIAAHLTAALAGRS